MSRTFVRPLEDGDRGWASDLIEREWGSPRILSRGREHDAERLPGFVAVCDGERAGLATYALEGGECEVITLNSLVPARGVGRTLLRQWSRRPELPPAGGSGS